MRGLRLFVAILMFVSSAWGGCRQANWRRVVQDRGSVRAKCNANEYMRGLWRNTNMGKNDGLGRIDFAKCCSPPASYGNPDANCVNANWWKVLDGTNVWALCPSGRYMQGIYKTNGKWLHNLEEGKCCKPPGHPNNWGQCYDQNVGISFDKKGWSNCNEGYYMVGLWKGGCDKLYCIEKFKCCKMQERINGGWSPFGAWGACSKDCGGGTQTRSRTCTNPPPAHGGAQCTGASSETLACNRESCPVNGGWSEYGAWGECSERCGSGQQERRRSCTNPPPAHGGAACSGSDSDARPCNTNPCPAVNRRWSDWSDFGKCSKSCGKGIQYKTRTCTNPPPSNGGNGCAGMSWIGRTCNEGPCPH